MCIKFVSTKIKKNKFFWILLLTITKVCPINHITGSELAKWCEFQCRSYRTSKYWYKKRIRRRCIEYVKTIYKVCVLRNLKKILYECNIQAGLNESNMRVWSWLRTNAGGRLNTCKLNGMYGACTMQRVAHWWVTRGNIPLSKEQQLETTANTIYALRGKDLSLKDWSAAD